MQHNTSFSKNASNYGCIAVNSTQEDNTNKLKFGTTVSNLLFTSSVRVDKYSISRNVVEIGSNTRKFLATDSTKIYLNMESLRSGKKMIEDASTTTSVETGNFFYQLWARDISIIFLPIIIENSSSFYFINFHAFSF